MTDHNRRKFLADVGRGMLVAGVGPALAFDMGLSQAVGADDAELLSFGKLEPLVSLMQDTSADKLQPQLVAKLQAGTSLKELITAGTLANARSFGGEDYIGYHTLMAMIPALEMSKELTGARQALPVLKVLYRNTSQIRSKGGRKNEVLHPITTATSSLPQNANVLFQQAVQEGDMHEAERLLAHLTADSLDDSYNEVVQSLEENTNVHRVVLTHRSYSLLDVVGKQHAETLLRQAVRFCVRSEQRRIQQKRPSSQIRTLLPQLFDQYHLASKKPGQKTGDDAWVKELSETLLHSRPHQAAGAVAEALSEGYSPEVVGEAISLAANQLVLRDPGRQKARSGKPVGSVHGDSVGVHGSDAVNAWRGIARVSNARNTFASLIVAGYNMAERSPGKRSAFPLADHLAAVKETTQAALLKEAEVAIRGNDQFRTCAVIAHYGVQNHAVRPMFDLLLRYAVSEDGALHAEKYYRTVTEEFAASRPAFRWNHLVALGRVTASEYGTTAAGYNQAVELLKLT